MKQSRPFVHLHCHTHYSLLDGATRIPDLVKKVKRTGMNAVAITDHGNLYGAIEFYNACRAEEINPILGLEAYVAPKKMTDRGASRMKEASHHLTLLAINREGFQNLIRMSSIAYLQGFYYKPRIDKDLLESHHEGLICLSGCAAGELSHFLLSEKMEEARALTAWYEKVFGDRFYMEIQNAGLEIQKQCAEGTIALARSMGLPLVATNDAHYLERDDAESHDVLLCVNTRSQVTDEKRMRMTGDQFFVRTPEQMYDAFPDFPDAVSRTQEIADRCEMNLDLTTRHFPVFRPPVDENNDGLPPTDSEYLKSLCEERLAIRYGEELTDAHRERLAFELSVIEKMGYSSYFLIVWDFVRFAEKNGIPCLARGSACGAIVAYLLGLSQVCPLKYDLLFERFLDPSRSEPPDIDIDFCRDRRQLVIDYTKEKYGERNVAQIGTFGTLKAKAAIRDVSRALGIPLVKVDAICKMVPETLNIKLEEALKESPELNDSYKNDDQIRKMFETAIRLEGLARSAGTHAAGVVVSDRLLDEVVPLQKITGKDDIITQWDGPTVEEVGLLKMDFLGLRNLTILDKAVNNVKKHRGLDLIPSQLPLDDTATYALLQRGETKGIFQLESGGMRDLLKNMVPDCFNDIIATSALYRPGPLEGGMVMDYVNVKHGRQSPAKVHPIVDEILAETYGVMVYQEQVMRILNRVGNIELSSAYQCIKAISKKKHKTIVAFREQYIEGAKENGIDRKVAEDLFSLIEKFAGYGFNKSHSTAYGAVAYQTAYLKAHYPVEFMAALLSCGMENSDRISEHIEDCRRTMKIEVLPPEINRSQAEFGIEGESIVFGLGAIKGLGKPVVSAVVEEREKNGPFKNIFDLAERVDTKVLTKNSLELLVKSGTLDLLHPNRAQSMAVVERSIQSAASLQRDRSRGQMNLFGGDSNEPMEQVVPTLPEVAAWTPGKILNSEKEVFGFYLTSHPLIKHIQRIERHLTHQIDSLVELDDNSEVVIGGMISSIKKNTAKKPNRNGHSRYVNFDLEDTSGKVRCIMWPDQFARQGDRVKAEAICFVKGKVDRRGREPNVIVDKMMTLEEADKEFTSRVVIKFHTGLHQKEDLQRVLHTLKNHPGKTDVLLVVDSAHRSQQGKLNRYIIDTKQELKVGCTDEFSRAMQDVLGKNHFRLISKGFHNAAH